MRATDAHRCLDERTVGAMPARRVEGWGYPSHLGSSDLAVGLYRTNAGEAMSHETGPNSIHRKIGEEKSLSAETQSVLCSCGWRSKGVSSAGLAHLLWDSHATLGDGNLAELRPI